MVHFVFYFLFVILWLKAIKQCNFPIKNSILILAFAILYGLLMEFCQKIFTTNRSADFLDALANTLGAITGYVIINLFLNNKK